MFSDEYKEKDGKKYFAIDPKEVITPGMNIKFLSPSDMGELTIIDIIDIHGKSMEKSHCNSGRVYMLTDKQLKGWEILYE